MANVETVENKTEAPPLAPLTVPRGDLSLDFVSTRYIRGEDEDGNPKRGQLYLSPPVTEENLDYVIKWINRKTVAKKVGAMLRMLSQGWWEAAMERAKNPDTGIVDQQKLYELFGSYAGGFEAQGESIPQLKAQLEEVIAMIGDLNVKKLAEQFNGDIAKAQVEFFKQYDEYNEEIRRINAAISGKKRGPKSVSKDDDNS